MPIAKVFNMAGEKIGEIELSEEAIFGVEPNKSVLHDSVKNHLANCRQGTQSALTKGEVCYTTRKPLASESAQAAPVPVTQAPPCVDARRRSVCPQAQRLQLHSQPQGQETGAQVRSLLQGSRERDSRYRRSEDG